MPESLSIRTIARSSTMCAGSARGAYGSLPEFLVVAGHFALGIDIQPDGQFIAVNSLDHAGDNLTDLAAVVFILSQTFSLANPLLDHLTGSLSGHPAKIIWSQTTVRTGPNCATSFRARLHWVR